MQQWDRYCVPQSVFVLRMKQHILVHMVSSANFEESLDVLLLTEMWHTNHDDVTLRRCLPPVYAYTSTFRVHPTVRGSTNYHGSVAVHTCCVHMPRCVGLRTLSRCSSLSSTLGGPSSTLSSHTDLVQYLSAMLSSLNSRPASSFWLSTTTRPLSLVISTTTLSVCKLMTNDPATT